MLGFFILLTLVIPPYVQSGLNKVWNLYPAAEGGQMVLSPAAAQPEPAPTATQGQAPPQGPPPDPADRLG